MTIRSDDNVDLETTTDVDGEYNIGWMSNGEWLEYTLADVVAGVYTIDVRAASDNADPGEIIIKLGDGPDGDNFVTIATVPISNTGGWENWQTFTVENISIDAGTNKVLRFQFDEAGYNINWIDFTAAASIIPVSGVSITRPPLSLDEGQTVNLDATVSPPDATDQSVSWSTSDASVATVDQNGVVSALSIGQATITVTTTDGGFSDQCTVSVEAGQSTQVLGSISRDYWTEITGKTVSDLISLADYPDNPTGSDELLSFEAVDWNNPSVNDSWANKYGERIYGYLYPPGNGDYTFWIYGDDNCDFYLSTDADPSNKTRIAYVEGYADNQEWNKYASQKSVTINLNANQAYFIEAIHKDYFGGDRLAVGWAKPGESTDAPSEIIPGSVLSPYGASSFVPVTGISISQSSLTLVSGQSEDLDVLITPSDATDQSVSWSSSNTSVATVDANGVVSALSSGQTTITATTVNGFASNCVVSVSQPPTSISVDPTVLNLIIREIGQLTGTILPVDADDKSVSWSSSNASIATVDANGVVSALSDGLATITATTNTGGLTASSVINVVPVGVTGVALDQISLELIVGATENLTETVYPANATDKRVQWTSSNNSIAFVDSNGVVSALSSGQATITVTTTDGGFSDQCTVSVEDEQSNPVLGSISRDYWTEISGKIVSDLTSLADYPDNPTGSDELLSFEAVDWNNPTVNDSWANKYGERIYGYLYPPENGDYSFWIYGDDNCDLYLSTDADPANKTRIAYVEGYAESQEWNKYASQKSVTFSLNANQAYFIEAIHKDHFGGDRLAVGWAKPGESTDAPSEIIPGSVLSPYGTSSFVPVTSINISQSSLTLVSGQSEDLDVLITPSDATDQSVSWSSSNTSVATVDDNGAVSALSAGQTTITATNNISGLTAQCSVTIEQPATEYIIDEDFSSGASDFTVIAGGTWDVTGGKYVLSNPASGAAGLLGNISLHNTNVTGDFELSTLLNITGTTSIWNDAAVIFNFQDVNNYYYVIINESNDPDTKGIFKIENGTYSELVDITASILSDTDYILDISKTGNDIVVSLDGVQIAAVSDATFSGGQVGYGTKNDGAQFDDLLVSAGSSAKSLGLKSSKSNCISKMLIYPNPNVGDNVFIELPAKYENAYVLVYDINGKRIIKQAIHGEQHININLSNKSTLKKGVYVIEVSTPQSRELSKLIVR